MPRQKSNNSLYGLRLALALIALLCTGTGAAAAEGYWSGGGSKTSAIVGYVVPSYSPNEFVAFWMKCSNGAVTAFVDFASDSIKHGNRYDVEMVLDGRSHRFPARAAFSEMHQYALLEAPLNRDAPVLSNLATAKSIRINAQNQGFDLSSKKLREGMQEFLAACAHD